MHFRSQQKKEKFDETRRTQQFFKFEQHSGLRPRSIKVPKPSRIFRHSHSRIGRVFFLIYLLLIALLAYVAMGHASPPSSRGARPIALGNGYSAVAGDPYALFYNPGALAEINSQQIAMDYGRSYSEGEFARTDFNGIFAMPYRYKGNVFPAAVGFYAEGDAPGAHAIDITVGSGMQAPVDKWSKGFFKLPTKLGAAVTLRQQHGAENSDRVGKSTIGIGLTGGAYLPLLKNLQAGASIRNLFLGESNPEGPSIVAGVAYQHNELLHMFGDLEFGNTGVWRFDPGFEWLLIRGVLRPRLGWGFRDNGHIDSVATGLGFYVSPFQIDLAYLVPVKTLNDNAGQFRASLIYKFGKPQFSEIYYDRALEEANHLDQNVLKLSSSEAELKASLAELEQKKRMAQQDLMEMKVRIQSLKNEDLLGQRDEKIRTLQYRVKDLENQLEGRRGEIKELREKKASIRTHVVKAGETLQNIAIQYYGDPNAWKKIYSANPDKIERGLPRVGAELVIP